MIATFERRARRAAWLNSTVVMLLYGCHASETGRYVDVPEPTARDASVSDADADTDEADGGRDTDAATTHGPAPLWPEVEQALVIPYGAAPMRAELTLAAIPARLDLHLNVDATASFTGEIANLKNEVSRSVIPRLVARVADTHIGVSRFADFPILPFGRPSSAGSGDVPFRLLTPVTASLTRVTGALSDLVTAPGDGADAPEAGAEALYQIATGRGFTLGKTQYIAPFDPEAAAADGGGMLAGVGFRPGALHVVLHMTDAPSHTPDDYAVGGLTGTHGMDEASAALAALGVYVVGINSATRGSLAYAWVRDELSAVAVTTGAYTTATADSCATGVDAASVPSYDGRCPWVFDVASNGTGLADSVVDAVLALLDGVHFSEVHAEPGDDPLGFIQRIELLPLTQPRGVVAPRTADRLPSKAPDGVLDSYVDVAQDARLGFAVWLANTRIMPSDAVQHYRVSVRLIGDGVVLEERVLGLRIDPSTSGRAAQVQTSNASAGP